MKTIGVDLRKDTVVACVLDETGAVLAQKTMAPKCRNQIRDYFASYGLQCQVAVERVGFYSVYFSRLVKIS